MVIKFVKNVWGHGWVKVIHCPYKGKDEGPRTVADRLTLHLLDVALIIPLTFSFLILVTHNLLRIFFILLFLLGKGVSKRFPFWGRE